MADKFSALMPLLGVLQVFLVPAAWAMPFSPDPISFGGYLSYTNWGDPSLTIRFEHLGNCTYDYGYGVESYSCETGYAVIKDAYSRQKCRVKAWFDGTRSYYNKYECRDLKTPEQVQREAVKTVSPSSRLRKAFDSLFGY